MVEHERCSRCHELGLTTVIVPQRGPKEYNVPGDKRIHECFKCGFKSISTYKKGQDPRFPNESMSGYWYWEVNSPKKRK
jgi:hypothetical protein